MMQYRKITFSIWMVCTSALALSAQEGIPSAGGNASGAEGSVSYTIGQIVYHSVMGSNGSALQGLQQPYEISVVSGMEEAEEINVTYSVYPNPATDFINLDVGTDARKNLSYELYDMNGKLLTQRSIDSDRATIDMKAYIAATYFLRIVNDRQTVKTFQLIKH